MIIVRERFESRGKRIAWSSPALECSACRSDRDVAPADDLAKTGFCGECLDGSRSHVELGGES